MPRRKLRRRLGWQYDDAFAEQVLTGGVRRLKHQRRRRLPTPPLACTAR